MFSLINMGRFLTPKNVVAGRELTNAVLRPAITMSNDQVPIETRRYTAVREFCTELIGLAVTLSFVTVAERAGGQFLSKKLTGKFLTKEQFKNITQKGLGALSINDQKIKGGILLASFVGSIIAGGILTPLINNLLLNKFMHKIIGKKENNKDKNKDLNQVNLDQLKLSVQEKKILKNISG